ncbi:MAG: hypothetical protein ACFE8U_11140, partial [Candidatus Hermodarchaeota archaeon]
KLNQNINLIKASYVEDVIGKMNNLSLELKNIVADSAEKTKDQFESNIANFIMINEELQKIGNNLDVLVENQADQLNTLSQLRDSTNAIIQVELTALRDRVGIHLETSLKELKTVVVEQRIDLEKNYHNLVETGKLTTTAINSMPDLIEQKLNTIAQSQSKDIRKMAALVVKEIKDIGSRLNICPHCAKKIE